MTDKNIISSANLFDPHKYSTTNRYSLIDISKLALLDPSYSYLVKEIFQAMTAVTVVLLLIVMSGRLAKYLGQAVAGELAADVLIKVMLYRIPDFLPLILPLALFVGVLLAYGRLYAESEMIVMSACGTSRRRLALITLVPSLFVAGLVACLTLWIAPAGLAEVQGLLDDPDNVDGLAVLTPGRFQASPSGRRLIYVESLSSDKDSMTEVFLLDRREQGAQASLSLVKARVGTVISGESYAERYCELDHGHAYVGVVRREDVNVMAFERMGLRLENLNRKESNLLKVDATPTRVLLDIPYGPYHAALHWRLALPIVAPIVALIALVLSRTDHRRGRYIKMLPAIVIYLLYLVLLTATRDRVERSVAGPALMWSVHGVFLLVAFVLFNSDAMARKWRLAREKTAHQEKAA